MLLSHFGSFVHFLLLFTCLRVILQETLQSTFHLGGRISFVETRKLSLKLPSWERVNCNASQYAKR